MIGEVVDLGRDVQRRGAVALRRVHVGSAIEQRADGRAVVAFDGFDQGGPVIRTHRAAAG